VGLCQTVQFGTLMGEATEVAKFESWQEEGLKKPWKVVRLDLFEDVPGFIVAADEESGFCTLNVRKPGTDEFEAKTYSFGLNGLRIVRR
jgi:hypothetical protein